MNDAAKTRTFKSQRSATMAVNKADKAYEAAVRAENELQHQPRPCGDDPELAAAKADPGPRWRA